MEETNDFLANLQKEGEITPNEEEEKETLPEPPADKKPEDIESQPEEEKPKGEDELKETPEEGEPAVFQAFHKHPRWQAVQEELKELREFRETASPLLEDIKKSKSETETIPAWFSELYGENEAAWNKYHDYDTEQRANLRKEIMDEISQQSTKSAEEQKKNDKWVEDELTTLESEGLKFNRNELMKVALEYLPTDNKGNISFRKALDIYEKTKPKEEKPNADAKKKIAAETMQKGKPNEDIKDYKTSHDLVGKSFRDLIPE
ncbi:MAG: hypothetical protein AAB900_02095 [Patescibacteria group bacterium]